jgi:hypothetical protein
VPLSNGKSNEPITKKAHFQGKKVHYKCKSNESSRSTNALHDTGETLFIDL